MSVSEPRVSILPGDETKPVLERLASYVVDGRLRLPTNDAPKTGSSIRFEIREEHGQVVLAATGTVVRVEAADGSAQEPFWCVLEATFVEPSMQELCDALLASRDGPQPPAPATDEGRDEDEHPTAVAYAAHRWPAPEASPPPPATDEGRDEDEHPTAVAYAAHRWPVPEASPPPAVLAPARFGHPEEDTLRRHQRQEQSSRQNTRLFAAAASPAGEARLSPPDEPARAPAAPDVRPTPASQETTDKRLASQAARATYIGKYRVVRRLGAGGMAEVFECRLGGIGGFDKKVVLKRILPERIGDAEILDMFLDEARLVANLTHPNIVQVFAIEPIDGLPHIAMEYVDGPSLAKLICSTRERGPLPLGHAMKIVADMCRGLHYAHNARDAAGQTLDIVHRDVSPHNVMVSYDGVTKLLDFGVAKAKGRRTATRSGIIKGKPAYFAPEQLAGEGIDHRIDVFAAGICLYEATTGRRPYLADGEIEMMGAVLRAEFPAPSAIVPDYPPELERIVLWAMAKEPQSRCPSCAELCAALDKLASSDPRFASDTESLAAWVARWAPPETPSAGPLEGFAPTSPAPPPPVDMSPLALAAAGQPSLVQTPRPFAGPGPKDGPRRRRAAFLVAAATAAALAFGWVADRSNISGGPVPPRTGPAVQTADTAPASTADASVASYLTEAERLLAERSPSDALGLLRKAAEVPGTSPQLSIRLVRLRIQAEHDSALAGATSRLAAGDLPGALEQAKAALERHPEDPATQALVAETMEKMKASAPAPLALLRTGPMSVVTTPPASVFLDGLPLGRAPIRTREVTAGHHLVHVRLAGYASQTRDIDILQGQPSTLSFVLDPAAFERPVARAEGASTKAEERPVDAASPSSPQRSPRGDDEGAIRPAVAPVQGVSGLAPAAPVATSTTAAPPGRAAPSPKLQAAYAARHLPELGRLFSAMESELTTIGGFSESEVRGISSELLASLAESFSPGQVVEIYPQAMYEFVVRGLKEGRGRTRVGTELREAHEDGRLRAALGGKTW